jgi:hypothetical protein
MKKSANLLHYFDLDCRSLQDAGILQIFYSRAVLQRTILDSHAFLEPGLAEKIAVCAHIQDTTLLPKKIYYYMKRLSPFNPPINYLDKSQV